MQKGKIGVTTENIFPIIKKFLYSDHEIFLRELVSNAVDASQKLRTLANVGEYKGDLTEQKVRVDLNKKKGTITISDNGIGMTSEEVVKYLNEIAFSSAEDFLEKYKDKANAIIGHFGLGFYSSFMVSSKVEVVTKSYKEGSEAVKWTCDGSPEYALEEAKRDEIGTDVILYIDKESKEFLEESRITDLLNKYCKFLPVEIVFGKVKEWKDGKEVETDKDNVVNNTKPAWVKPPVDLKEEDYKSFYRELYPYGEEPLFHIHLNVDYPFNLTGILYFPKIKNNIEIQKNKIQLYCNQVFVTDSVEGIVPEFLTLLHGVIDSPDIPLNVSRSYLQSDSNVKKISNHITKKVADRLQDIFKNDREEFEKKWDNLKLFIIYGMITEEKFYEKAIKFSLLKNTDKKYFTVEEYEKLIKENQTDKDKNLIILYASNSVDQFAYIESAKSKGYDVLLMDGQLDSHFINHYEQKNTGIRFVRVDSDVVDKLIQKEDNAEVKLTHEEQEELTPVFKSVLSNDVNYLVTYEGLSETDNPILITQSEFMRRMKDMAEVSGGMGMYGQFPDSYNLVVNANHPLINKIVEDKNQKLKRDLASLNEKISSIDTTKSEINTANKDKKPEEIPQTDKDRIEELDKKLSELREKKDKTLREYGKENKLVKQLIDLALLSNNMLKGEELNKFVKRSIELI